ncbi:hypothetical protein DFH09DRAFT_1318699 [Mycena vulgaris]|nr:hypothetical protein DFH09DRAFT_1318699 [Mycena vulgaris]
MATDAGARSKHTPADQEYLDSLSARQLMDFRDYVFSATYVARNAGKYLDHEWVDIALLREYLGQPQDSALPDASTTRSPTISDPVRAEIKAPLPSLIIFSRPVHDFKSLVSPAELTRLMDFTYIDSKESLDGFSSFVYGLKIKKISVNWWRHKEMHEWIIPCIVKSQSLIPADIWDATPSTTNTNEAQHHWTNSLAGIKLSPLEALESRHKIDQNVADEIKIANPPSHANHASRADISNELQLQINASTALTKTLKAQLKVAKGTSSKRKKKSDETLEGAETSSSAHGLASAELSAFDPAFDPTLFGMSAEWNILMPFSALPEDPVQDFMNLYGFSAMFSDAGAPADFGTFTSTGLSDDPLPLLPPPSPESPPAPSPVIDQVSEAGPSAPRSRRSRQEVDEANILHSRRARAPTKRFADGDLSTWPQKKAKGKQVLDNPAPHNIYRIGVEYIERFLKPFRKTSVNKTPVPSEISTPLYHVDIDLTALAVLPYPSHKTAKKEVEKDTYKLASSRPRLLLNLPERVTFTSSTPFTLPRSDLLAVHAAACRVAYLSGAAEYLELRDVEEGDDRDVPPT